MPAGYPAQSVSRLVAETVLGTTLRLSALCLCLCCVCKLTERILAEGVEVVRNVGVFCSGSDVSSYEQAISLG